MHARHHLGKFLLRHGQRYPGPDSTWTRKHLEWLRTRSLFDGCSQATLAASRRGRAVEHTPPRAGKRTRATDPRLLACLVIDRLALPQSHDALRLLGGEPPSETRRRQGLITKAGPQARRLTVEAAHHYRHPPRIGANLARRLRSDRLRLRTSQLSLGGSHLLVTPPARGVIGACTSNTKAHHRRARAREHNVSNRSTTGRARG